MTRWYFVNQIGMATVCADKSDAEKEASVADQAWPRHAPHVVMQLVDAAQLDSERAARQAAQRRIEELQAQLVRADAERCQAVAAERCACLLVREKLPVPESCTSVERALWDVATLAYADAISARGSQ